MTLVFERTGQRRYAVRARRAGARDLVMSPAPGYDPLVPHDLLHMVVEARLGLMGGIFGQLASDGGAGTFHAVGNGGGVRAAARQRRARWSQLAVGESMAVGWPDLQFFSPG